MSYVCDRVFANKCLNCQPCVQFIFSPRCESDMILSVMTILRRVWSRTNTCSHAKRKLRAYDSCTELGSASAYLWRNLSSRSTTSLLAAHAVGFVAAESLTKIRVQTIQGRPPRDAKKCRATTVLGRPERH